MFQAKTGYQGIIKDLKPRTGKKIYQMRRHKQVTRAGDTQGFETKATVLSYSPAK